MGSNRWIGVVPLSQTRARAPGQGRQLVLRNITRNARTRNVKREARLIKKGYKREARLGRLQEGGSVKDCKEGARLRIVKREGKAAACELVCATAARQFGVGGALHSNARSVALSTSPPRARIMKTSFHFV
jgi:hypothetical protein